jgi:hypothetical protein
MRGSSVSADIGRESSDFDRRSHGKDERRVLVHITVGTSRIFPRETSVLITSSSFSFSINSRTFFSFWHSDVFFWK